MGRRCSVKGCISEKTKTTLFSAPESADERRVWSQRLGLKIVATSYVCEKHFNPSDVISEKKIIDSAGNEIFVKLLRHTLKRGALPCEQVCLEPARKLMKLSEELNEAQPQPSTSAASTITSINEVADTDCNSSTIVPNARNVMKNDDESLHDNFDEDMPSPSNFNKPEVSSKENFIQEMPVSSNINNSGEKINEVTEGLYDLLVQGSHSIKYPNTQWVSSHCIQKRILIFSFIDAMPSPSGSGNVIPIFQKQVIVHNDSRVQIRFYNKNIQSDLLQRKLENIQDFEILLQEIDVLNTCHGGPSVQYFKNVHVGSTYKDGVTWRHNKCPIILSSGNTCLFCSGLYKILSQSQQRQKVQKLRTDRYASESVKNTYKKMCNKKRVIKQRLTRKERKLNELTEELNKVHQRFQSVEQNTFDEQLKKVSPNLTDNQITLINECLAAGKVSNAKSRRYTHEWILLCMLLYIRSSAAYNMLKDNGILPLPAKSTISKYLRSSNTGCGFDAKFFKLFKKKMESLPEIARNGMLSFDEISVRRSIEVNAKTLTFDGLVDHGNEEAGPESISEQADHALVFMFSSLYLTFRQPVGMFGSKGTTKTNVLSALVLQAIVEIEKAGGKVHGIVCDGATTNRSMWKTFGVSGKIDNCKNYFENPFDEKRSVYAFSDAPHLIKCIRNRLEQKKCLKVNGGYVKWAFYEALYYRDIQSNLRVCPKLTENHIKLVHAMKMRVSLATQLFSNSVSAGLQYYSQLEKRENPTVKCFEGCEWTRLFTLQINNLFDVLNRSHPKEGIQNNSKDFDTLREAITWLDTWEREKESDDNFLTASTAEGLRVTLHSTLQLSKYLLECCDFKYVLSNKMNQDCLEQFFGIVRQAGCQNDHPTFPTFMQLYHLLSVYKILRPPKYGNCTVREREEAPKITLNDFKETFKDSNKSYRKEHVQKLKDRIDGLIEYSEWECDEIIDSDYKMDDVKDCIIYYVTGFVSRKMFKSSKCDSCKSSFKSSHENLIQGYTETELVNVKSRGGLVHPNINLFRLFQMIEFFFQQNLESSNIYELVVENILNSNFKFTFPCTQHKYDVISYCIFYYITLRMRQYSKIKNKELKKVSQEKKKIAKLYSN